MLDSTADYSWLPDISAAGQLVSNQKPKTNLLSWSTMFLLSQGMCMTKIYNPHLETDKYMSLCLNFQWKCLTMSFKLTKGTQGQTNFTFQNPCNKHLISLWHTAINVSSGVVKISTTGTKHWTPITPLTWSRFLLHKQLLCLHSWCEDIYQLTNGIHGYCHLSSVPYLWIY